MTAIGLGIPQVVGGVRIPLITSTYLGTLMDPRWRTKHIDIAVAALEASGVDFDAIAYTGVSGGLVAPVLAYCLGKSLIVVRKPDDKSTHSVDRMEGDRGAESYIVADDFVSSGKTLGRIISSINKWSFARCAGCIAVCRPEDQDEWFKYYLHPDVEGNNDMGAVRNLSFRRRGEL